MVSALLKRAPLFLFVAALLLAAFASGLYVARYKVFPYGILSSARKTFLAMNEARVTEPFQRLRWVDIPPDQVADRRFEFIGSDRLTDPILVPGGRGYFREHCPGHVGCIAVEYAGRGEVRHAWPYRPGELAEWLEKEEFTGDFPYEHAIGFSFVKHAYVKGISKYANGDLLAVFQFAHSHPSAGGVARIDRSGKPVWYRPDYSHHRPHLTDGEVLLVPGLRLGKPRETASTPCPQWLHDTVNVIDPGGRRMEDHSLFDAIRNSTYAPLLRFQNPCNPTHLNSIQRLGKDTEGWLEPGDLVLSIRNFHAFAILDHRDHRLKRLMHGSFFKQHDVLHFKGSRFLMLDNQGARNAAGGSFISRLLMVDTISGEETTIFPNHRTPAHLRKLYTDEAGGLDISPDRSRAIVTISAAGKAVEVRIADGAVLVVFDSIHDVSQSEEFPEERATRAARRWFQGIRYSGDG